MSHGIYQHPKWCLQQLHFDDGPMVLYYKQPETAQRQPFQKAFGDRMPFGLSVQPIAGFCG